MTADLYDFNSTFFLSLATMTFGFFAGALGYALKSKCSRVKCCCIEIIRDVELEADIEESIMRPTSEPVPPSFTEPTLPTPPIFSRRNSPIPPTTVGSRRESLRQSRLAHAMLDFKESMKSQVEEETKEI